MKPDSLWIDSEMTLGDDQIFKKIKVSVWRQMLLSDDYLNKDQNLSLQLSR